MKIRLIFLGLSLLLLTTVKGITNSIAPTANPLLYVVRFDSDASTILSSTTQLNLVTCKLNSVTTSCIKYWGCSDNTCLFFGISATSIPLKSTVTIDFTSVNSGSPTFTNSVLTISTIAYDTPSSELSLLSQMEFYMAIIWGGFALINMFPNPASLVYLVGKLYMETLDTFKMANINYDSWLNNYFYQNNNRVAGLRVPNLFSILLFGDSWNSGYDLENYLYVSVSNRNLDNKIYSFDKVQQYTPYSLFLDNYGIQVESLVIVLFFILFVEFIRWLVLKNKYRKEGTFTLRVRYVCRYNLFYAIFYGSYMTALFYGIVQIFAYANSNSTTDNLISLIIACVILAMAIVIPILSFFKIKKLVTENVKLLSFHSILVKPYKQNRLKYPMNLIILILRTIGFVAVLVIPNIDSIYQISIILALEVAYVLYLLIARPFAAKYWLFFQIIYEIVLLLVICCMEVIAVADYQNDLGTTYREIPNFIIGYCSISLPYLNSIFAITEIIMAIRRGKNIDQVTPTKEIQGTEVPVSYIDPSTIQAFKADPFVSIDKTEYVRNTGFAEVSIDHAERGQANTMNYAQNNRGNYISENVQDNSRVGSQVLPDTSRDRKFSVNDNSNPDNGPKKFNVHQYKDPFVIEPKENFLKTQDNLQPGVFNISKPVYENRDISRTYGDTRSNHILHGVPDNNVASINYLTGEKINLQSPSSNITNYYPSGKVETKLNFDNIRTDPPPIRNKNTIPSRQSENRVHVFNDSSSRRNDLELNDKSRNYIDEAGFRNYTNKFATGV